MSQCAIMREPGRPRSVGALGAAGRDRRVTSKLGRAAMDDLCRYVDRPFAFIVRYVRQRPVGHSVIVAAVFAAVACSVTTQYGVKYLVDALAGGPTAAQRIWEAFALLVGLIAADNLLWRIAGWVASFTFVRVTGDLRRDLFRHLTGHPAGRTLAPVRCCRSRQPFRRRLALFCPRNHGGEVVLQPQTETSRRRRYRRPPGARPPSRR